MPSFEPKTLWEAAPHTCAKIAIVRGYIRPWFEILGRAENINRLIYIDGFAGPGEYANAPVGSPIAALNEAKDALLDPQSPLRDKELHFHFIEKEDWIVNHLRQKVSSCKFQPQIKWKIHHGSFENKIPRILADIRQVDEGAVSIFCFIDPFGATGVPFEAVRDILASDTCEILLNLDSDGIARLMAADNIQKNLEHLNRMFGDTVWRSEIGRGLSIQQLGASVLAAYKRRLPPFQMSATCLLSL
jgi:three-Cys-motif partner protein